MAATAIVLMPRAAAELFSMPILLGFAIGIFALFTFFDMAWTVLLSVVMPSEATGRKALIPAAFVTFGIVLALFLVGYGVLPPRLLVWLAAAQAAVSAVAEYQVAKSTHPQYGCLSCYTTVFVQAAAALALPFAGGLNDVDLSLALAGYLVLFGTSELSLGGRMLFLEYRAEHPAPQFDLAWKAEMEPVARPAVSAHFVLAAAGEVCNPALTCDGCAADARCRDNALTAQVSALLAGRQPSIVNSMRAATLVQSHR